MTVPKKNRWKNVKAVFFGIFLGLVLCEIILRIYNPFPYALKRGKLIIPSNIKATYHNTWIKKLDSVIHYSRNSLGFRGPEPPDSVSKLFSVITVGGSTTECKFQSDSLTWPAVLGSLLQDSIKGLWLNNAGLDGHSTFGHLLLTKNYLIKLKPKVIIFLTGYNDVETEKPELFDLVNENRIHFRTFKGFIKSVVNKTEIGSTLYNWYEVKKTWKKGLRHEEIDFTKIPDTVCTKEYIAEKLKKQDPFLAAYRRRIDSLINLCKQNGIEPIWLTQPSPFGDYIDIDSKQNMKNKWVTESSPAQTSELNSMIIENYNDVVRSFSDKIKVVDLARLLNKRTGYYYDKIHFTNFGSAELAKCLSSELSGYLKNKFSR